MAYVTQSRAVSRTDIPGRIRAILADMNTRMQQYRIFRRTLGELDNLSERELADLGINRSMIRSIAHEAAYGNP